MCLIVLTNDWGSSLTKRYGSYTVSSFFILDLSLNIHGPFQHMHGPIHVLLKYEIFFVRPFATRMVKDTIPSPLVHHINKMEFVADYIQSEFHVC